VSCRPTMVASLLSQSELHFLGHQLPNVICRSIQTALFRVPGFGLLGDIRRAFDKGIGSRINKSKIHRRE